MFVIRALPAELTKRSKAVLNLSATAVLMLILKLFLWLMRHLKEIMFPHLNLNFAMRDFFKIKFLIKMNITSTQKADICKLIEGKNYAALGDMLAQFDDSREADVIKKLPLFSAT